MLNAIVARKPPPGGSRGCKKEGDLASLLSNQSVSNNISMYRATDASCVGLGVFLLLLVGFFPPILPV